MQKIVILFIIAGFFLSGCHRDEVKITRNSKVVSRIVISGNPSEIERHSAKVLQDYISQISGASLEIVPDAGSAKKNDILLGKVLFGFFNFSFSV